jgi:single-strand DNA-binding protein
MLNLSVLMGRLTRDPEVKMVSGDLPVAKFTLAVNRPKYGDKEQQADFIPIVTWRKTAEFVEKYFTKGMQVYVTGRIQTRSWDADDGTRRYATDVVADNVGFAEGKKKDGADTGGALVGFDPFAGGQYENEDDLPF